MHFSKTARSFIVLAVFFIVQTGTGAQNSPLPGQPLVLTLEKAITLALEQNRDILIAEQDCNKAEALVGEAKAGAFPQISVSGQYVRNIQKQVLFLPPNNPINPTNSTKMFEIGSDNAYLMGAQLSQALFNRKLGVALDIARRYRELSDQGYRATTQEIILEVKKSFYLILLVQQLVEANRQGLDVVRANYENIRSQYRYGTAAEYDALRAEVQLANTEPLLISAENNYALSVNALKNLLSIPLEQEVQIRGDFSFNEIPVPDMEQARQTALAANPLIKQLVLQESILEKNILVEKANYFPSLSLVGAYNWQSQDNTYQFSNYHWAKILNVGVVLSYTLFDGFKTKERVQQAVVDHEKVHYTRLKLEEGLKIQIQSAELKMTEATKRISGQGKNIEQAQKAVRIAQTRFKSGVGTQLELLDAQVAMTRAQTNHAQAIYDYLVARAEWEYAVGMSK
jgi:outer membrane protein